MKLQVVTEVEIPEGMGTFQAVETKIREALSDSGKDLLNQVMTLYESVLFAKPHRVVKRDRRAKYFKTMAGEVRVERWRVWDGKKNRYPLDEWLGVSGRHGMTPAFERAGAGLAVQRSYRQAAGELSRATGVKVSGVSLWKTTQKVSLAEQAKEVAVPDWYMKAVPALHPSFKENPCRILAMDPDGTYCHNRRKAGTDHEVKVAVLYTGKEREGKTGKRWKLKDRQVVLSVSGENPRSFFNRVTQKAMSHYGAHADTQVIIHGDGDPWIKSLKTAYWDQALIRLDPWHVIKKMVLATGQKEIPRKWKQCIYGNPDRLICMLEAWKIRRTSPRSNARQKMDDLTQYIRNNREGLLPSRIPKEVKQKHPRMFIRGSGTIESHVGHAFAARFKLPRMSWSKKGLKNLTYLREKYLNGDPKPRYRVPQPLTRRVA